VSQRCLAKAAVKAFCGKVKYLKKHVKTCDHVPAKWKAMLKKEEDGAADASDDSAAETDASANAPVGTKRQSRFVVEKRPAKRFKAEEQTEFEGDVLRLITVLNASFNLVGHTFVEHFFEKWSPGAKVPGRDALSNRILDAEVAAIQAQYQRELKGEFATASVDGWNTKHDTVQQTSCNVAGRVR
jgi:hypothetical protein